jgi:hypothetical protein
MRRRASLFRCHSCFLFRARLCGTTAIGSQPRTQCCPSRCALNHICELKNRPRLRPRCRPHVAPCERGLTCSSFAAATARSPRPTWMNNFPDRSGCRSTAVRCSSSLLRRLGVPRCDVEERDVGTRARQKGPPRHRGEPDNRLSIVLALHLALIDADDLVERLVARATRTLGLVALHNRYQRHLANGTISNH